MAQPQKRKRRQEEDDPPPDPTPPSKKATSSAVCDRPRKPKPSNFPPEFYDGLSKIWLTRRALQELDRRNKNCPLLGRIATARSPRGSKRAALSRLGCSGLAFFAAGGGPDLSDIRGCLGPTRQATAPLSPSSISQQTQQTRATTVSSRSRRSSAYDANFEQSLIDCNIFPPFYRFPDGRLAPKPNNFNEIRRALRVPRASLSPSIVPETAFEAFQFKNTTKSKGTVMRSIVPSLAGNLDIPNKGHIPFLNLLGPRYGITTITPVPDFFDGALPGAVDKQVRDDLDKTIIPTKHATVPVAPNLFLEVKGPGGAGDVALRQAILNGGHGATIMHALNNYLKAQPVYDGNAYAFGATYIDGALKLYAHHLAPPADAEQRPAIYTTQLKAYALTGDHDIWLEGTGAFRTLRMLAKRYRDQFIEAANARARQANAETVVTGDDLASTIEEDQQGGGSSPVDFHDCLERMFAEPGDNADAGFHSQDDTHAELAILDQGFENDTQD